MAASMVEQVGKDASGAPMVGMVRPVVSSTSQAEEARLEPPSVQVAVSAAGRTEGGAPKASFVDVAIVQASVSTSPAPLSLEDPL